MLPILRQQRRLRLQGVLPVPAQRIEHIELPLIHDEILHRQGDAIGGPGLAHGLDVVVFKSCLQAGGHGHGLRQRPDKRHTAAGHGEGHRAVHQ